MIDYFAHIAVFERVREKLAVVSDPDLIGERNKLLADSAAHPEAALLGSLVDHLLMHSDSTGAEIDILGRAAELWKSGRSIYDTAGSIRAAVEGALANPVAPGATASFNAAMATLVGLRAKLSAIQAGMDALGSDATQWRHLPDRHPRQRDMTISQWASGDRFLARRTEAFVRATFKYSKDPRAKAFALGALSSYAGNVAGSAYLCHVVGGPRRAHPRRDRIARNAIGAWIRANRTLPDLQAMKAQIHRSGVRGSSALQPELETFLQQALKDAFPGMPPANLSLGFARLERHLELLAVFVRAPLPVPPSPALMATMATLSSDGSIDFSDSQDDPGEVPYGPPPPMGPDPTPNGPSKTKDNSSASACLIGFAIVTILYFVISGIVALAQGKKWHPFDDLTNSNTGDAADEEVNFSSQQLVALSASSGGTLMIAELFNFQMKVWQAMEDALTFLVKKGLVYPDELTVGGTTFSQFTSLGPLSAWPMRTEDATDEGYLNAPSGPAEQPLATASPFPIGSTPFVFVDEPTAPTPFHSAAGEAVRLWLQIARGQHDSNNYDLDADRGHHAPCWQVTDKTSINDDPVVIDVLAYKEI